MRQGVVTPGGVRRESGKQDSHADIGKIHNIA